MGDAIPGPAPDCRTATFTAEHRQSCGSPASSDRTSWEVASLTRHLATSHAGTNARGGNCRTAAAAAAVAAAVAATAATTATTATAPCSNTRRPGPSSASSSAGTSTNSSASRSSSPGPASDGDSCTPGHTRCSSPAASTTLSAHTGGADPRRPADFPSFHNTGSKAAANAGSAAARAKARNVGPYAGAQDARTCTRTSRSSHSEAGPDSRQIPTDPADPVPCPASGSPGEVRRRSEARRSPAGRAAYTTPAASRRPVATAKYSHSDAAKETERYPILITICSSVAQDSPGNDAIFCQDRSFYEMDGGLNAVYASPAGCRCH